MDISEFAFRLFLLFLPGIIAFLIVDALTVHSKTSPFFAALESGILGLVCYLAYYGLTVIFDLPFTFIAAISDNAVEVEPLEILISTALSIPIGFAVAAVIYHKLLFKLAALLHVSKKISDPGVWSHVMALDPKTVDTQWVSIIDEDKQLLYHGFLQFYSDNNDVDNEFFLRNVDVYVYQNQTPGELLYQTPAVYLNGKRNRFKVEFPNVPYLPDPFFPADKKSKSTQHTDRRH